MGNINFDEDYNHAFDPSNNDPYGVEHKLYPSPPTDWTSEDELSSTRCEYSPTPEIPCLTTENQVASDNVFHSHYGPMNPPTDHSLPNTSWGSDNGNTNFAALPPSVPHRLPEQPAFPSPITLPVDGSQVPPDFYATQENSVASELNWSENTLFQNGEEDRRSQRNQAKSELLRPAYGHKGKASKPKPRPKSTCDRCGKHLTTTYMNVHKSSHCASIKRARGIQDGRLQCPYCVRYFSRTDALNRHLKTCKAKKLALSTPPAGIQDGHLHPQEHQLNTDRIEATTLQALPFVGQSDGNASPSALTVGQPLHYESAFQPQQRVLDSDYRQQNIFSESHLYHSERQSQDGPVQYSPFSEFHPSYDQPFSEQQIPKQIYHTQSEYAVYYSPTYQYFSNGLDASNSTTTSQHDSSSGFHSGRRSQNEASSSKRTLEDM